jgi:hypothetical protein
MLNWMTVGVMKTAWMVITWKMKMTVSHFIGSCAQHVIKLWPTLSYWVMMHLSQHGDEGMSYGFQPKNNPGTERGEVPEILKEVKKLRIMNWKHKQKSATHETRFVNLLNEKNMEQTL